MSKITFTTEAFLLKNGDWLCATNPTFPTIIQASAEATFELKKKLMTAPTASKGKK